MNFDNPHRDGLPAQWFGVIEPQGDRDYFSVDRILFTDTRLDSLVGTIERLVPVPREESEVVWSVHGNRYEDSAIFLTFFAIARPEYDSRGTLALLRTPDGGYSGEYQRIRHARDRSLIRRKYYWRRELPQRGYADVALLDVDNTLRSGWLIVPWLESLRHEDVELQKPDVVLDSLAELFSEYSGGLLDHDSLAERTSELYRSAVSLAERVDVARYAKKFVDAIATDIHPFVEPLLVHLKAVRIAPILVSGAPQPVVRALADRLDIEEAYGMCFPDDRPFANNPGISTDKHAIVHRTVSTYRRRIRLAVGDSDSDKPMWNAADSAVVVGTYSGASVRNKRPFLHVDPTGKVSELTNWLQTACHRMT